MNTYIEDYTSFMTDVRHKSANTVESYKRDITQYMLFLDETGVADASAATKTTVLSYMLYLQKKGKASSTISRTLASLRSFYVYMQRSGAVINNPTSNLEAPHVEKKMPQILTGSEVERLLEQPSAVDNKGMRDKAMLELLYATGIRVSELISLDLSDVNVAMSFIRCRGGKKERIIPMGVTAKDALAVYLKEARPYMIKEENEEALFVNMSGQRLSRQGFWKLIKYYRNEAGIQAEITPHTLRHSFATAMLNNGAGLENVQKLLGHESVATTEIYTHTTFEQLKKAYENAHPRA